MALHYYNWPQHYYNYLNFQIKIFGKLVVWNF